MVDINAIYVKYISLVDTNNELYLIKFCIFWIFSNIINLFWIEINILVINICKDIINNNNEIHWFWLKEYLLKSNIWFRIRNNNKDNIKPVQNILNQNIKKKY